MGLIVALWVVFGGHTRMQLSLKDFRIDWSIMWRILKISIPVLTMNIQRSLGNFLLTFIIAPFGTIAVAAHSVVSRVEMFLHMPGMALGNGAGVLVGQNIGSGQIDRAEKSAWMAAGLIEVLMLICGTIILIWAEGIMAIFTSDLALIEMGSDFLRIASAGYVLVALSTVLQSSLAGAGDTITNMVISIAMVWVIQLPLSYALANFTGFGVYGIRWAMVTGISTAAIAYAIYFRCGRWKTKKI
jgi:Na+-driven multidrug efflux pump